MAPPRPAEGIHTAPAWEDIELRGDNMNKIQKLLDDKGTDVWSVAPTSSVYDALLVMADKNIGAVLVMDNDQLVGILTERDYTRNVVLQGRTAKDTQAREIMTERPVCVGPEQAVDECLALMTERRVRHLPVVAGNRVLGLVSIGDAVKDIISEQKFTIEQLERYISG
jgi:CBS domain-containing protein